jgi:hypothetical protein
MFHEKWYIPHDITFLFLIPAGCWYDLLTPPLVNDDKDIEASVCK